MIPAVFIAVLLAQIEGQVVNAITGAPLKKAAVLIESDNGRRYVESTDAAGKFKFEEIEPGEYNLSAERVGFLKSASESDITAAAGETVKGIVLKLTPASVIAGRVIDEDGDPVPGAQVAIRRYSSKREILTEGLEANGEGGFIFTGLKPGRYILSATKLGDGPLAAARASARGRGLHRNLLPQCGRSSQFRPHRSQTGKRISRPGIPTS
jgi:hypothetical protein